MAGTIFVAKRNLPTNNLSLHGITLIICCALNGLPGPMRHWFTGFTHSLTHSLFAVHFPGFSSFFASMHANHFPPVVRIQQLNVAYGFSPLVVFEVDSTSRDKSKA